MKNQWRLIIIIVLLLFIITFAILNGEQVPINFGFAEVAAPIIIIIFISLLLGSILTLLVSTISTNRNRKELKTLRQQVAQQEQELKEAITRVRTEYESRIQGFEENMSQKDQLIAQLESQKNSQVENMTTENDSDSQ